MEKKNSNNLKALLVGAVLLFVLFSVIVFTVLKENKNATFFLAYFAPLVPVITLVFFVSVALSGTDFNNDAFAKKVTLFGGCFVLTQTIASLVLLICNNNAALQTYITAIVSCVIIVVFAFLLSLAVIHNKD